MSPTFSLTGERHEKRKNRYQIAGRDEPAPGNHHQLRVDRGHGRLGQFPVRLIHPAGSSSARRTKSL